MGLLHAENDKGFCSDDEFEEVESSEMVGTVLGSQLVSVENIFGLRKS